MEAWKRWQSGPAEMRVRWEIREADGEVLTVRSEAVEARCGVRR